MNSTEEEVSTSTKAIYERRYDIDWLRIVAVIMVFIFHCSIRFNNNRKIPYY